MGARWLIALMPVAAHAAGIELEVAPGYAWSTDISASAPVLRARLGVEYLWFAPSIVAVGAFLSDPGPRVHYGQRGGWTGWGLAAEVRFHTNGEERFLAAVGAGWGQLSTLQVANGDTEGHGGKPAPYVEAAIGYQWVRGQLRLGLELTLDIFNRVNLYGDLGTRFCVDSAPPGSGFIMECPTGRSFPMVGLALTLGFAP
jgi:hypothetical protein